MVGLAQQVSEYVAKRNDFLKLEEYMLQFIRASFSNHVPRLNNLLPEGYRIEGYKVVPPQEGFNKRPAIHINHVTKNGVPVSHEEFPNLDDMLADEFKRFEEELGYQVQGFVDEVHRI